jgi:dephospho-CoA kinase
VFTLVCTGGIGSGKSYCAEIFQNLGVPVYVADSKTKDLYLKDTVLQSKLNDLLGIDIVIDGALQKEAIAAAVFSDGEMLNKVNTLVHPAVLEDFCRWREGRKNEGFDLVMLESAIYFESPVFEGVADKTIVVLSPLKVRIERIVKRDSITEEMVMSRVEKQMSDEERSAKADYRIYADGERAVLPQIMNILKDIKDKRV